VFHARTILEHGTLEEVAMKALDAQLRPIGQHYCLVSITVILATL
jgi:hypothetical protein